MPFLQRLWLYDVGGYCVMLSKLGDKTSQDLIVTKSAHSKHHSLKLGVKFSFLDISRYKDHVQKHPVTLITLGNKNKIYKLPCSTQNTRHVSRVKSHIHQ